MSPGLPPGLPVACAEAWPALDALPDGLALFDPAHCLLAANRSFRITFGIGIGTGATGLSLAEILDHATGHGLLRSGDQPLADWPPAQPMPQPPPDLLLQLGDGGWVRLAARFTRDDGMLCQVVDITQQMRIWTAIEAIPDGFVLFDSEDKMVICNQSYRDIYKTSAPMMSPGVTFEEILRYGLSLGEYPEARGREEEWVRARMLEHRGPAAEGEHQLKDGRWLRSIDKETPDGGRVGLRVDITQLREQAAALEAARLAAEAASRAKSAFLANMSHEIRTPMNGVVGMADLLCDTTLSDEQRLFAETIRSSGEALLVIINDILDYSKIEAERLTLHPEDFDFERTIHEVVMLLQPRAREKGIDLMIDYDVFLPTRFTGDPGRLRQVLTNLIGNAVKFTASGHVLTRVVGMEVEDGRHQLHVTVEDTGIGIPTNLLDHVFGEFYQVDDERNRKFEGTGLGLAITRRLIERMDGAVWVDSEYGKGSVFGFRLALPLAEDTGPERLPVSIGTALVVDDQFINRTILERQLTPCGTEVVLSRSGQDALERIAAGLMPDVVLADHEMPGMDGVVLAKKLRKAGYDKPLVLLSSSPLAAREAGGDAINAILQKPVLRAELYRLLTSLTLPAEPKPALPEAQPPVAQSLRAMRILAAEDNRTNQLVLQKMLRSLDIELRFAGNGHEALAEWESYQPDLIFMDVSMPGMDGREATRAIRASEAARGLKPVPIIALTAHAMEGDEEGILASGMDRYLTKPLRKSEISAVVMEFAAEGCRPPETGSPF
ncbi:hybrid sensor histidine kinase/response regulator [Pseudogemmobacter bohemicus]|uniref:hybrid sensor histidine kinase/response regulator n=1 Tax=Pseudogemmobacter bohemicus TaxID=2250708 RepID=UPI001E53BBA3|nr:response regulator [Pseudogemmobacter bohemicus]